MGKRKQFTISSATLISTLDGLVTERESFENEEYARSNKRLYAILGEIYKNYLLIKQNADGYKDAVKKMTAKLKNQNQNKSNLEQISNKNNLKRH